jgi:hypothetical protein
MQDIYLSFKDEKEANAILFNGVIPNYQNIDVIGVVYKPFPITTPDDYVPIPYPSPNWGVNIRLLDDEDIEPLRPYIVEPKNPIRVWATDNTLPTD